MNTKGSTCKKWTDSRKLTIILEWNRRNYVADVRRVINKKFNKNFTWATYHSALVRFGCIDSPLKKGSKIVRISRKEQLRLYKMHQKGFMFVTITDSANGNSCRKSKISVETIKSVIAYMDEYDGEPNPERYKK